jgi:hypothetical protein
VLSLLLEPGEHSISIIASGQTFVLRALATAGGQAQLEGPAPAPRPATPDSTQAAAPPQKSVGAAEKQPPTSQPARSGVRTGSAPPSEPAWLEPSRYAAWSLTGAGALTTLIAGSLMLREQSALEDACNESCDESERESVDRYHRSALWTNAGLAVLAAGTVATVSLYVFVDDEGPSANRSVTTLRMSPGALELHGQF